MYTKRTDLAQLAVPVGTTPISSSGTVVNLSSYSPDNTGATPSDTAMTNAITAAGVGGTINIGAGTFKFSSPIYPLENQTINGSGIDVTILKINTSTLGTNFAGQSLLQGIMVTSYGHPANPGVTISNLTVNGGRKGALWTTTGRAAWDAAHPTDLAVNAVGEQVDERKYDTVSCPDNAGGGIACKVGWTVDTVRFTNINGAKCAVYGAHGAVIKDSLWDNNGNGGEGSNSGEKDQIGGGQGIVGLLIDNCWIGPNCVGSGIDITQGKNVVIRNCFIHAYSLILEGVVEYVIEGNYIGPVGGIGGAKAGDQAINIKPNTQYASSVWADAPTNTIPGAGAFQPRGGRIVGNTLVETTKAAAISIQYTDNSRTGFPFYVAGGDNLIENNSIIYPERMGIQIFGNSSDAKIYRDIVRNNRILNVVPLYSLGVQTTFTPGVGTWQSAGIGINIGVDDEIYGNIISETRTSSIPTINGVDIDCSYVGSRTWPFENTFVARNVADGITGSLVYAP